MSRPLEEAEERWFVAGGVGAKVTKEEIGGTADETTRGLCHSLCPASAFDPSSNLSKYLAVSLNTPNLVVDQSGNINPQPSLCGETPPLLTRPNPGELGVKLTHYTFPGLLGSVSHLLADR